MISKTLEIITGIKTSTSFIESFKREKGKK